MDGSVGFGLDRSFTVSLEIRFEEWWKSNFAANEGSEALEWVKKKVRPVFDSIVEKGLPAFLLSDFIAAIRLRGFEPGVRGGGSPDAPVGGTPIAASLDRLAA